MPKPTQAELLLKYAVLIPTVAPATGSKDEPTAGSHKDVETSEVPDISANYAQQDVPSPESDAGADSFLTFSPASSRCPSLTYSSSPTSLGLRSASSSDNGSSEWSDFECEGSHYRHMCTPLEAKALSLATNNFYAVTNLDKEGLVPGDEPQVEGMILQGYNRGQPLYYKFSGMHADLSAILTETAYGKRYVRQPVESCFGRSPDHDGFTAGEVDLLTFPDTPVAAVTKTPLNRDFQNDWFTVAKSPLGGYGVVASKNIPAYTHILLERPFLKVRSCHDLDRKYRALGPEEKLVYDGLHGYSERKSDSDILKKYNANSFFIPGGAGMLAIATNFNHACHSKRNVQYYWDNFRMVMVFTTDCEVLEGQELLISYDNVRLRLKTKFGFLCHCGGCEVSAEEARILKIEAGFSTSR